jgi:hypothetical protein
MSPEDYLYYSIWDFVFHGSIVFMGFILSILLVLLSLVIAIVWMFRDKP